MCKTVLDVIRHKEWEPNSRYNPVGTTHYSEPENEPDMLFCPRDVQNLLPPPFFVRANGLHVSQLFSLIRAKPRRGRRGERYSFAVRGW